MISKKEQAAELRRQAEEKFQTLEPSVIAALSKDEVEKLFHELRVHQIEMEMQNEELRRIQDKLELARARYFDLYDLAPVGYLTLSEQGLILEINLTSVTLLEVPRSALVKRPFTQFILKEDQDIYYLHRKKLFETREPQTCEMRLLKSDGELLWTRLDATAAQDADGAPVCRIILTDITENKQEKKEISRLLEESNQAKTALLGIIEDEARIRVALQESEKSLVKAQSIACLGSYALDIPSGRWKSSVVLDEILGIDKNYDRTLDGWLALIHPDDRAMMSDYIKDEVIGNRQLFNREYRIIRQNDRAERWVQGLGHLELDATDAPVKLVGTIQDVTERKQTEAAKERFLMAISQVAETIVITDADGTIQYVNPAFERVNGYTREEAIGQNPRIFQSGQHDAAFYQKLWNTLLRGEVWSGRMVNKKKDGSLYTEEATISPVKDAAGKTVNYVAVKRDVTEELKLEEQIRQSLKMQSIGQLVGGVAHDFNNLIQIINGFTQIAQAEIGAKNAAAASLYEVAKAGARAKDLVKQLLAFSRQQVIDPVDLDLNGEIEQLQKMLGRVIGEHIQLEFAAEKEIGTVFVDKSQISQVLINLCANARDAMPDGGTLTIETKEVSIAPADLAVYGLTRPGRYVLLSIADTGCGMDQESCSKIFEPFFTTKEVGKGTGLGLSSVYGIVKQNEGHIEVNSKLGQGTVFKIYLPVSSPLPTLGINAITGNAVPVAGGEETILVVEDEEMILKLSTRVLRGAGYRIYTAQDGEEAVRLFEEHADEIDLVMMDVVMPRMGGKKAMEEILSKRPAMRHLFVSGYSQDAGHNDFIKEKGLYLLNKPYQAEALLQKVREVLEENLT
ncbi:MAG: PAS domain S-box protein [Kiritimatiellae bacterium]|jgi:PAS domain S-box-containing protein|nr:PAS domain S-box protein [Kiritimatiellia bacterium]